MSDEFTDLSVVTEPSKWCSKCEQTKPFSEFHKNSTKPDGKQPWCRLCSSEHNKHRPRTGSKSPKITRLSQVRLNDTQKLNTQANLLAMKRLAENHWREFQMLVSVERERLGLPKRWSSVG